MTQHIYCRMIVTKINKAIPIDAYGKCHIAELVIAKSDNDDDDDEYKDEQKDKKQKNLKNRCLNGYAQIGVNY